MKIAFTMFPRGHSTRSSYAGSTGLTLLFVILFSASQGPPASAQQPEYILFHGVISDNDTRQPLQGAHYLIRGRTAGSTDSKGMFSLYAMRRDTITFTCVGYRPCVMTVADTLMAGEYVAGIYLTSDTLMIPAVVILPRLGNIRAEIMSGRPALNQELINATNNLRISAYQGLTGASELGDPAVNYELLRQKQRYEAYEKGQISSGQMVALSPLTLIPVIYMLVTGPPRMPEPPAPYLSSREMEQLRAVHDSLIYRTKGK